LKWKPYDIENLRFDSGVTDNSFITVYYDPMICKVISFGNTRDEAIEKMIIGLKKTIVLGTITNKNFLIEVLKNENFRNGNFHTNFILKNNLTEKKFELQAEFMIAAMIYDWNMNLKNRTNLKFASGFKNSFYKPQSKHYKFNSQEYEIKYSVTKENEFKVECLNAEFDVKFFSVLNDYLDISVNHLRRRYFILQRNNQRFIHCDTLGDCLLTKFSLLDLKSNLNENETGNLLSEVPGKIWKILKKDGDVVKKGETLLIIESMKMENKKFSPKDGIIKFLVKEGELVNAETILAKIE
jgi:acetyl/propionyl-CoA carboxylase alpha subunit